MSDNPYRDLPSVDAMASSIESPLPRPLVVDAIRRSLEQARADLAAGIETDPTEIARHLIHALERSSGVRVINASGVLLHTNLGRAPWSQRSVERATRVASGYSNLEIDLETGERSRRGSYVERMLAKLTGAEASLIVNNNASALLIALAAVAGGRSVPVSRGELIEIGGSYRLPEVMEASGVRLVEVGTTNRTRIGDYRTALQTYDCGALLKVHPSNYRVEGFVEAASVTELAKLAVERDVPLVDDIGSGLLDSEASWVPHWLRDEPGARQALADGAGIVTFSGDKLLGGPQAGIILGSEALVDSISSHPLARALRVDGVRYAALAATLEEYLDDDPRGIPFWAQALLIEDELRPRCEMMATSVGGTVVLGSSAVGAGSAPGIDIPTPQVRLEARHGIYQCLLDHEPPVLTRREAGDLLVDLRAVDPGDDQIVVTAIQRCL